MANGLSFAGQQEEGELSFSEEAELEDAYNNCIANPDPQLKSDACDRYAELSAKAGLSISEDTSVLSGDMGMYTDQEQPRGYADGGEVFAAGMPTEMEDEEGYNLSIMDRASDVLDDDDYGLLSEAVDMHPELPRIFDSIVMSIEEFEGEGPVEGPGTETSDSIPAKLSDGEFVFTAKAVKQLGVDKLYRMMKKAEEDFDSNASSDQEFAMGGFVQRKCK